ncbi:hypothetical protein [Romboutsia sp. 1001216sp1]|uniref:hypothetical protein n=3 Tax=Romboutsia sp. 1001216sp1 TaxID=2986997 RepID=UPI00325A7477
MSMLKSMSKEELIDEIYVRAYSKNYFHEELLRDDIDYIASCTRSALSRYVTLKEKNWDKQTSVTTAMSKYLRYKSDYNNHIMLYKKSHYGMFMVLCDEISEELCFQASNHIRKHSKYKTYIKDENISYVKYFARILCNKTILEELERYSDYFREHSPKYKKIYIKCRKQANENVKEYEELIKSVLNEALDYVDYTLENKQIIKYVNQMIRWRFMRATEKLPGYKLYVNRRRKMERQVNACKNIPDKREFVLREWFNLNDYYKLDEKGKILRGDYGAKVKMSISEVLEMQSHNLNKNQVQLVKDVVNNIDEVRYNKNKKGEYDLQKSQLAKILGISYDALEKRIRRIREKNISAGIVLLEKEKKIYEYRRLRAYDHEGFRLKMLRKQI